MRVFGAVSEQGSYILVLISETVFSVVGFFMYLSVIWVFPLRVHLMCNRVDHVTIFRHQQLASREARICPLWLGGHLSGEPADAFGFLEGH